MNEDKIKENLELVIDASNKVLRNWKELQDPRKDITNYQFVNSMIKGFFNRYIATIISYRDIKKVEILFQIKNDQLSSLEFVNGNSWRSNEIINELNRIIKTIEFQNLTVKAYKHIPQIDYDYLNRFQFK